MFNSLLFNIIPIIVITMFIVIFCIFIYQFVYAIKTKVKNDNSPLLKVPANVVDKRANTYHHNNSNMHSTSTNYYVTFEFESGDRLELRVNDNEFGYIVVGDYGDLEFQGTRFVSFIRY